MRIAVNAGSFKSHESENELNSVFEIFLQLAASQPDHTFFFILDKPFSEKFNFPANVSPVVIGRKNDSPLKLKVWYNFKIPIALKKHKAGIFISEKIISLKTKIPQILISPDLAFIYQPSFFNKKSLRYYKKNTKRFFDKANEIIVNSVFFKNEIIKRYKINEEKIKVIYPEISDDFKKLDAEEKELIKEKYAEGNEYFIYKGIIGPQQNLLNLLKAFSFFKKRQKSKMQLIILGNRGINYEEFIESLRLFKFNKEVKVLENLPAAETAKIVASAYAMVDVPVYQNSPLAILEAMKSGVAAIVSPVEIFKEFCGDAALFAEPGNYKDIAEKMMQIFKDEQMRTQLIEKANTRLKAFPVKKDPDILWEIIKKLVTF
jgi:glycosyltransferase involved in cell wall biosynthesis